MITDIDLSLVNWSRAQFALTAIYHWLFVPLTLGLSFILAITESIYVRTGKKEWKETTQFWMKLFGINFAIGVATGIILEFEFGTNWSTYSWIVGDIFGAPLAIEGIMAFFLESTFIAVMFFGWNKVSRQFHLLSTWLVAIGSNLSALWILVANGWMQNPIGMVFNPDSARSEMNNFWEVLFNPMAVHKFLHTISSSYIVGALFVTGISAYYLLKNRHIDLAKRSIAVSSTFGILACLLTMQTGDTSANAVAKSQPMKLAAMEGLYEGTHNAELVVLGMLNPAKTFENDEKAFYFKVGIPGLLSILANRDAQSFVPGIKDLIYGNLDKGIEPAEAQMFKGKKAIESLAAYKAAKASGDSVLAENELRTFRKYYKYIGYGYITDKSLLIPSVGLVFYAFHAMVGLGFLFIGIFALMLFFAFFKSFEIPRWLSWVALFSIPLGYLASELGWVVAEVGRQPWTIQGILPTMAATSRISSASVMITFFLFAALFAVLLIAELKIMLTQIKKGPEEEEHV